MQSPITAARPWPTCSGPVGLAETYSTPARVAVAASRCGRSARPAAGSRRTARCQAAGGEVEIDEARAGDLDRGDVVAGRQRVDQRLRDRARVATCAGLASSIAALVEKSPWLRSFGRSITNSGVAQVGRQGAGGAQGIDALGDQGAEMGFHEGFGGGVDGSGIVRDAAPDRCTGAERAAFARAGSGRALRSHPAARRQRHRRRRRRSRNGRAGARRPAPAPASAAR